MINQLTVCVVGNIIYLLSLSLFVSISFGDKHDKLFDLHKKQRNEVSTFVCTAKKNYYNKLIMITDNRDTATIWCGGCFFFACEDFGRQFDHSFPACAVFLFFFRWRLFRTHSLGQVQSTVAK